MAVAMPNIGTIGSKRDFSKGVYLWHPEKEGTRRVDTQESYDEAIRDKWTEKYREQHYPRIMHSPNPDLSRIAHNKEEEDDLLAQGFELDPKAFTSKQVVDARIAAVEAELRQLRSNKKEIDTKDGMKRAV